MKIGQPKPPSARLLTLMDAGSAAYYLTLAYTYLATHPQIVRPGEDVQGVAEQLAAVVAAVQQAPEIVAAQQSADRGTASAARAMILGGLQRLPRHAGESYGSSRVLARPLWAVGDSIQLPTLSLGYHDPDREGDEAARTYFILESGHGVLVHGLVPDVEPDTPAVENS